MSALKVVVDTNIWVSATRQTRGPSAELLNAWLKGRFRLIMSPAILAEHRRVLFDPRVRKGSPLTDEEVEVLLDVLSTSAEIRVPGALDLKVVRDPTDNKYLAAAVEGQADYIVSGDKDLLDLGRYEEIKIISPRRFLQVLAAER